MTKEEILTFLKFMEDFDDTTSDFYKFYFDQYLKIIIDESKAGQKSSLFNFN